MIQKENIQIAVLGTGYIGKTLSRKLSTAGYRVKVANSRGPETIGADVLETGAEAMDAASAIKDAQVVILSIPMARLANIAPLIRSLPQSVILADTSNYYPHRDGMIDTFSDGQVESLWVAHLLNRPGEGLECNRFRLPGNKRFFRRNGGTYFNPGSGRYRGTQKKGYGTCQ